MLRYGSGAAVNGVIWDDMGMMLRHVECVDDEVDERCKKGLA